MGFLVFSQQAEAVTYDLLAPSGQLSKGQDAKFTINVDTEGKSLSTAQIGMTYDATVLQYVSTLPGNTFTTVTADPQSGGKLVITGSSTSGYSGSGTYAYVTFKIIAQSSGSTQLCALYNPSTVTPTSIPVTSAPAPTALPRTGSVDATTRGIISGLAMITIATVSFILFKKL